MASKPAGKPAARPAPTRTQMDIFLGKAEKPVGRLIFAKDGQREFSQFVYSEDWLVDAQFFDVSTDLNLQSGYQLRKPPTKNDACFFLALADTEPDAWGRRVIARARAKDASLEPLTEADYLACVDDFSRLGALRLRDVSGQYLRSVADDERSTPAFLELEKLLLASRAAELSNETAEDLAHLQGKGNSLGGMRPKCTILDSDGALSLGKFPSVNHERSVTRGELLALRLAQLAGIDSAQERILMVQDQPVYSGNNQWRLAPAFDVNPFPDMEPESKTWLSEDSGPINSITQLLGQAARYELRGLEGAITPVHLRGC